MLCCVTRHDGIAFVTQHMALTNAFELSAQAMDPSVTVPFWDFTHDEIDLTHKGFGVMWATEIWGDGWFGSAIGSTVHTIEVCV
jgi:hypothetical protein